jgi:hypothetical protein
MARDPYVSPEQLSGYTGEQDRKPEPDPGALIEKAGTTAADNRGHQAPYEGSGSVSGAGAGAGGGGGPEEYDSDPQAGGGKMPMPASSQPKPDQGADAPEHGSH